jgi:SAM-dependent methyltransferase
MCWRRCRWGSADPAAVAGGRVIKSLRLRAADALDAVLRRRDPLTPPRRYLDFVGDSDFAATGEELLEHFRSLGGLRSTDRVLDIGCGIGRMARVLAPELQPPGSYDGFDIVAEGIAWCRRHYRATLAPFRFEHADLSNAQYNPAGRGSAASYRFPYPDGSFDFAIATSVFTHLLTDAAENYIAQAARVLRPGGRLFATFFLLGGEAVVGPGAAFEFAVVPGSGDAALADPAVPEAAVAFQEAWLRSRLAALGLRVREPVHYGSWRGGGGVSFQDIVVAERA